MKEILAGESSYATLTLQLRAGETVRCEPGSMVHYSGGVTLDNTKAQRNWFKAACFGGESFFVNVWRAMRDGEITLAGALPGAIVGFDVPPGGKLYCRAGVYLASTSNIRMTTKFQGKRGFFAGGLFMLSLKNESAEAGRLWVSCFGNAISAPVPRGAWLTLDADNLLVFDPSALEYNLKWQKGVRRFLFSGDALTLRFRALRDEQAALHVSSHSLEQFADKLAREMPRR